MDYESQNLKSEVEALKSQVTALKRKVDDIESDRRSMRLNFYTFLMFTGISVTGGILLRAILKH
jgi:hypothetical protein